VTQWDEVNENVNAVNMPGPQFKKNSVKCYRTYLSIILMVLKNNWLFNDVSPPGFCYFKLFRISGVYATFQKDKGYGTTTIL
jgi:hypothetical protein